MDELAEVDMADYNCLVRIRIGSKALRFKLPPRLIRNGVGDRDVADVVLQINRALRDLQVQHQAES